MPRSAPGLLLACCIQEDPAKSGAVMNTLGLIPALEFHPAWRASRSFSVSTAGALVEAGSTIMVQESFMRIDGKSLLVGAVFVVGAFVWASQAFPQTLRLALPLVRIPYTVDSVF